MASPVTAPGWPRILRFSVPRAVTSISLLLVGAAGLGVGALSDGTLGIGTKSVRRLSLVLMAVAQSFRRDLARRFPEESTASDGEIRNG